MASLNGTWIYQSLRPFTGPPSPVVPWSPRGKLIVTTDRVGKVDGNAPLPLPPGARMPELVLAISGLIRPVAGPPLSLPEGVQLMGKLKYEDGRESVNELRGYFVAGGASPVIVGTVYAIQNDPGGEPDNTNGPFVLFPAAG